MKKIEMAKQKQKCYRPSILGFRSPDTHDLSACWLNLTFSFLSN